LADALNQSNAVADSSGVAAGASLPVAALTRALVQGDEAAYRTFHETYVRRLSRYLLVITRGNEDAAREALQATLVRVVRHIKVFPDETQFWNWLTVLARTALADQRRKQQRYFAFLDRFTVHARTEAVVANNGAADARLLALLDRGLHALPQDDREVVERKYFNRQSVREIAEELQSTEKAVESRLTRVRRKLKEILLNELKHDRTE
jgi:RNA polymerase sigma-70 factor, ECF subfamily